MSTDAEVLKKVVLQALSGRGAHVQVHPALENLDWGLAGRRPEGVPHTVFQIVNHLIYWHDFSLRWLAGEKPPTPEHATESWPGSEAPRGAQEWHDTVARFQSGLAELNRQAEADEPFIDRGSKKTVLEILQLIASHNSYHIGQVALLRRMLGSWPPPGGGATW